MGNYHRLVVADNVGWTVLLVFFVTTAAHTRHGNGVVTQRVPLGCTYLKNNALQCHNRSADIFIPLGITRLELENVTGGTLDVRNIHHLQWVHSEIINVNDAIVHPESLKHLDLSFNNVTIFHERQLQNYTSLVNLNLSYNLINDLPRNVFRKNEFIGKLCLSHNLLKAIPFQVFAPMERLNELDLSNNHLVAFLDHFFKFNKYIELLLLNNNNITKITSNALADLTELKSLDLSYNSIEQLSIGLFDSLANLQYLNLANNPPGTQIAKRDIQGFKLLGMPDLETLNIRRNRHLKEIETYVFADTSHLKELDIGGNDLNFLPQSIANLTNLKKLNISDNPWACDCRMYWFASWAIRKRLSNMTLSDLSCGPYAYPNDMLPTLQHLNCTSPRIVYKTPTKLYRLKSDALLECRYASNPPPSITWITPKQEIFHWNPDINIPDVFESHPQAHDRFMTPIRTQVLTNGSLLVKKVTRADCGRYICFATNPIANTTEDVLLHIDPADWNQIRIDSLIFGSQSAAGFLGLTLLIQFLRYILNKCIGFETTALSKWSGYRTAINPRQNI
ncbi:hypothetical protein NQ317_012747 [Molorchus minor]|uniref:Ig-like domain-containing protein n=1 Tax=Molorchus minor TaxID=1323400 RepID=A0ABQ9K0F6_9CUCU|nr:hypothetical protein NQ317_012747 [Molorchus minor]